MPRKLKILLVDEARYRRLLARELEQTYGHAIEEAGGYEQAVHRFEQDPASFDLAIIDYSLEGERSGVELLRRLHETDPNLPVIIITGVGDRKISQEALRAGAFWYLDKPHDWVELEVLLKWVGRYRATSQRVDPQSIWEANQWMPVSDAIVSAQTIPDLVDAVRSKALSLLEAERCGILEVDPEKGSIRGWSAAEGEEQDLLAQLFSPLASDMECLGKPILASLTETNANASPYRAWAACACPPNRGATEILFALFEKDLTEEQKLGLELKLLTLARLIGVAIENLRKAKLLEALVDSGKNLLTVRGKDEIFQILKEQIFERLKIKTFYLALHQRSTDQIHFPVFFYQGEDIGPRVPIIHPKVVGERRSFSVYVLNRNEELTVENVETPPFEIRPFPIPGTNARAYFAVPMRRPDGSAFGVLSIQSEVPRDFPEPLKQGVRAFASLLAPALTRLMRNRLRERIVEKLMDGTPQTVLEESLHSIWEAVNADLVSFYPFDPKRKMFRLDQIRISPDGKEVSAAMEDEFPTLHRLLQKGDHFAKDAASDDVFGPLWTERYGTRSIAGVAFRPGGSKSPSGVVVVHFNDYRSLDKELQTDVKIFSQFTAIAANMVEQREQQDRIEKQRYLLETLVEVTDRRELAQIIEEMVPKTWLGRLECRLLIADRGERQLYSPLSSAAHRVNFGEGLAGMVAQSGELILAQEPSILSRYKPFSPQTRSALCVPILLGDSLLGVLSVETSEPDAFEEADRLFLEKVAKVAASTLVAASRKEATDMVTDAARRAVLEPERGLEIIAESVHNIVTSVGGAPTSTTVFLVTGKELQLAWAWPKEAWDNLWHAVGTLTLEESPGRRLGIVARAAKEGKTKYIPDINDHTNPDAKDYIRFDPKTLAELAVPVKTSRSVVVGVINLEFSRPGDLRSVQESLIERLAEQTEIIAILQNQARELSLERLNRAEEEKMRARATTLAFIGLDAVDHTHNLTNLDQELEGALAAIKKIGHLNRELSEFEQIAREILGRIKQKPDADREADHIECIPAADWARALISDWLGRSLLQVDIKVDSNVRILGNKHWLKRALLNILDNSKKFVSQWSEGPPAIKFRMSLQGSFVQIEIEDNGPGIPPEIQHLLFRSKIPGDPRHGRGCLLTSFIVDVYGGTIALPIDSRKGKTQITIEFPVAGKE